MGTLFAGVWLLVFLYSKTDPDIPYLLFWYVALAVTAWFVNQSLMNEARKEGILRVLRTLPRASVWILHVTLASFWGCCSG